MRSTIAPRLWDQGPDTSRLPGEELMMLTFEIDLNAEMKFAVAAIEAPMTRGDMREFTDAIRRGVWQSAPGRVVVAMAGEIASVEVDDRGMDDEWRSMVSSGIEERVRATILATFS